MTSAISDDCTAYYEYDLNSIRDKKTVNGVTYNFITQNGKVVRQTWTEGEPSHVMDFVYDNTGSSYICVYDVKLYEYVLNLQGDVNVYQSDPVSALGHDYTEAVTEEQEVFTCTRCGHSYSQDHDHAYTQSHMEKHLL